MSPCFQAFLLCVPRACDEDVTSWWLSAALLAPSVLPQEEQSSCAGAGNVMLPPRLGLPAELDQGLQDYIRASGAPDFGVSFVTGLSCFQKSEFLTWVSVYKSCFRQLEGCHCNANQVISEGRPLVYTTLELRVPGPSFLDPTPMTYRRGVAVLFAGAWRFSERTAAGIQRHLLRPLKALAFAVSSGARRLEARRKLGQLLPSLKGVWILHAGGKNVCLFLFDSFIQRPCPRNNW